jgi:DNA mismatch repair protein MutS2
MDRALELPALILLDEVGSGTDPVEGGALGTAMIDHFRRRGAIVVATTHDDALKSFAATTPEIAAAAFGFDPQTYAPTYRLVYGAPGRSLALEIAERLGMPAGVIADARARRSGRESQLAAHLARVDAELAALERQKRLTEDERAALTRERGALLEREMRLAEREAVLKKRLDDRLNERLREARPRSTRLSRISRIGRARSRARRGVRRVRVDRCSRPATLADCERRRAPHSTRSARRSRATSRATLKAAAPSTSRRPPASASSSSHSARPSSAACQNGTSRSRFAASG